MSDLNQPTDPGAEEEQRRLLLSKQRDEAWEAFKSRVKATARQTGILPDDGPKDAGDPGRRPE
jgi:hypothetical protein